MFRNSLKMLLTGGKSNRKNRSSDGGSEEPPDRRQASVDSRQSRSGQGTSTENDCAFEPDYAIPPLPVTEAPLRKAKFVESPRIPESELGSPTLTSAQKLDVDAYCPGRMPCCCAFGAMLLLVEYSILSFWFICCRRMSHGDS